MIVRLWRGWTAPENSESYETLLKTQVFPGILGRLIAGFEGIELLRRDAGGEVEFVTLMRFVSLDAVKAFAGEDYETAVVPPAARAVLRLGQPLAGAVHLQAGCIDHDVNRPGPLGLRQRAGERQAGAAPREGRVVGHADAPLPAGP